MTDESLCRSIRAIGAFLYLISFTALGGSVVPFVLLPPSHDLWRHPGILPAIILLATVAILLFLVAHRLRTFRPWARRAAIVVSCIGVFGVPFGTILCGPFLYVLLKSKHLFSRAPQPQPCEPPQSDIDRLAA